MEKNKRITTSLISLSLLAFCLCFTPNMSIANPDETEKSSIVKRPDFELLDLDGKLRKVSEWDNKVVIIVFWAVWDPNIHRMIEMLVELQDRYSDQGLQFVAISLHDDEGQMSDFFKDYTLNFPVLIGGGFPTEISKDYGIIAIPHLVFIDRDSYIRHEHRGIWKLEQIETVIKDLL